MTTNKPEVKRYNITIDKYDHPVPYETEHGQWVKYSSYKALQAECEKLRNLLVEIERGCRRRDMPSEQTISSWADAIDAAIQGDKS